MKEANYNKSTKTFSKTQSFKVDDCANEIPLKKDENGEYIEKNPYFYQLNKGTFPAFRKLLMDYPLAGNIMLFLIENMDNTNSVIVSYEAMSEVFGRTRQCLSKAVKHLKEHKFIGVYKTGNMNVYCLNANVVWHRSRENIKYAKFKSCVYMTFNEQMVKENKLKNVIAKQLKK
jgi:hypothetical protein